MDSYKDIEVNGNVVNSGSSGGRFFKGKSGVAPSNHRLIEVNKNFYGSMINQNTEYSTLPQPALQAFTKDEGVTGQFKPSNDGTKVGWYCLATGSWVSIDSTAV